VLWSLADRIVVMRQGEALARGSVDDLQRSPDPYIQGVLFPERSIAGSQRATPAPGTPLLEVRGLSKKFVQRRVLSRKKFVVQALEGIELEMEAGTTVAVLGRSGSGKSTLARSIAGFEAPDTGEVLLEGRERWPSHGSHANTGFARAEIQMIFQDAATSVNPRFTARQVIAEPLEIARWKTELDRTARVLDLMEETGLDPAWAGRLAGEFSGGQRQRLAFARALAAGPRLLIMDEALSGLDMPLQAQMVRLMMEMQARHGLTYLYISHDLNFVLLFAREIVVMEAGKIVERLAPSRLGQSAHPATRALVEASERLHAPGVETSV
jgi:ABC-type glutathione transport system ATPase component